MKTRKAPTTKRLAPYSKVKKPEAARNSGSVRAYPTIAVVGSLAQETTFEVDRIPKVGEALQGRSFRESHGGKGANIAIAAYRASHKYSESDVAGGGSTAEGVNDIRVLLNGAVGDDEIGSDLKTNLQTRGVDINGVSILKGEMTGRIVVMIEATDCSSSSIEFKGANARFELHGNDIKQLTGSTKQKPSLVVTHCTLGMRTVENVLKLASMAHIETVLSASPAGTLTNEAYENISHLVFNEHEAADMSGQEVASLSNPAIAMQTAAKFVEYGCKYVILTLGKAGAVYATRSASNVNGKSTLELGHVPAIPDIEVVDATGAG